MATAAAQEEERQGEAAAAAGDEGDGELPSDAEDDISAHDYGKQKYWDQRYRRETDTTTDADGGAATAATGDEAAAVGPPKTGLFDWYQDPGVLIPLFGEVGVQHEHLILMLGCGNSRLSESMHDAGFTNLTSIDYSPVVIDFMRQRRPDLRWQVSDVTKMPEVASNSADACIDKGTMDALMCSKQWGTLVSLMADEVWRVTRPGGLWVIVTFGDDRHLYVDGKAEGDVWASGRDAQLAVGDVLRTHRWTVRLRTLQSPASVDADDRHWVFICTKNEE